MKPTWWRDPWFWLLLLGGPLVWMALVLAELPRAPGWPAWQIALLIVWVYPVLEEVVFRGGLQAGLATLKPFTGLMYLGISAANVLTSLIFALFHLINQPPLWAAAVFVPSLVFGWAKDRYQSLQPCIALHVFYNLGFVLLFVR